MPGALGIVALLASLAFYGTAVRPLEERLRVLESELQKASERPARADVLLTSSKRSGLEAFYEFFQPDALAKDDPATTQLARLYAVAEQAGVSMRTAEYRMSDLPHVRLAEYTITVPVRGSYAEIRTLTESAFAAIPVLTLDQAVFRRKQTSEPVIEAELRFTIFLPRP